MIIKIIVGILGLGCAVPFVVHAIDRHQRTETDHFKRDLRKWRRRVRIRNLLNE